MSLDQLRNELAELTAEQQNHLAAYLVHLRHQKDPEVRREITARLDDQNPEGWISPGELREKWKD